MDNTAVIKFQVQGYNGFGLVIQYLLPEGKGFFSNLIQHFLLLCDSNFITLRNKKTPLNIN